jgi:hypothetical protein
MPFDGDDIDFNRTFYMYATTTTINGVYENPVNPAIANDIKAVIGTSLPSGTVNVDYFVVTAMPRLIDRLIAISAAGSRYLPTTSDQSVWNAKLAASEVTASATPNKVLRLNSSGQLPADITGDAASVGGYKASELVKQDETSISPENGKLLRCNANSKLPASITGDAATLNSKSAATIISDARAATVCTITQNTTSTIEGTIITIGKVMHISLWVAVTIESTKLLIINNYFSMGFGAAKLGLIQNNGFGDVAYKCSVDINGVVTVPGGLSSVNGWLTGVIVGA